MPCTAAIGGGYILTTFTSVGLPNSELKRTLARLACRASRLRAFGFAITRENIELLCECVAVAVARVGSSDAFVATEKIRISFVF